MSDWFTGNTHIDGKDDRGWFVGAFFRGRDDRRALIDIEIKWADHLAGDERHDWSSADGRETISILLHGRLQIKLTGDETITLQSPGDYIYLSGAVGHTWKAEADSTVLTVRWPSRVGQQKL